MEIYHARDKTMLSRTIRGRRKYIEATFGSNDNIRLLLSKEQGVQFEGDKAYLLYLLEKKQISSCQQPAHQCH